MLGALDANNSIVRKNVALMLPRMSVSGNLPSQEALIKLLSTDPQEDVRTSAAIALGEIGSNVYSQTTIVRDVAATGLAQMGHKAELAAPILSNALKSDSLTIRCWTVETICNIGG